MLKLKRFKTGAAAAALLLLSACSGGDDHTALHEDKVLSPDTLDNIAKVLWMPAYDKDKVPESIRKQLVDKKNLPQSFAQRNASWLNSLLADPDSCTPDYSARYSTLKGFSSSLSPQQNYAMSLLMGLDSSKGYEPVPSSKRFSFPADDAPANKMQVGWHFFVGSAYATSGEEFGVQMMFWHYAMLPPALAAQHGLSDQENQVLELHLAISRADGRHYRAKPYVVAGTTGLVQFSEAPFNYVMGKNTIRARKSDTLFPLDLNAWGLDEAGSQPVEIALGIGLQQTKGYVLNGDQGLSPACGGVGTLYYSVPALKVDSGSWIQLGNEKLQLASGKFWYDHQYGTGFMPNGNPRSEIIRAIANIQNSSTPKAPGGWEWMMMQLDDDTELGLAALHSNKNLAFYNHSGPTPPGVMEDEVKGLFIDKDGSTRQVKGQMQVTEWVKSEVAYAPYMATGTWYPQHVKLELSVGQEPPRTIHMRPIVRSGQQGWFANGLQYSEGAVYLENERGEKIGRGFLESTGWGNAAKQVLHLVGMEPTPAHLQLFEPEQLEPAKVLACSSWLLDPERAQAVAQEQAQCKGL